MMADIPHLAPEVLARVPWVTTAQMVEVDRAMVEDLGIVLLQMMEHAGRHLAHLARARFAGGDVRGADVVVLAGAGGNGGGALVCARRLASWGARVTVAIGPPAARFAGVPARQLEIARRAGIAVIADGDPPPAPSLIIDGLIGYGLRGAPTGRVAALARWANDAGAPVLALDVPSGLDGTTGVAATPTVRADATLTLALPKQGLRAGLAAGLVGELYLADIGVPPELYRRAPLSLDVPDLFAHADLVRLA